MEFFQVWHEINNSLTAVNLTLEFLQRSSEVISSTELVSELAFSLESLDHVKNVIQSATATLERVNADSFFDLVSLIQQVISVLGRKWSNSDLQLTQNIGNLELYGDKTALTQVFMNLCSNAIQSYGNKSHSGKLGVKIRLKKGETGGVEVYVEDMGEGIPFESQLRVFEPGFSLKKNRGGTGIGLALCKEIIEEKFGGQISFTSHVGKGSSFKVFLPERSQAM